MISIKYWTCSLVDSVCFKWFYHQMALQNTLMKATWLKNAIPVSKEVYKWLYISNRTEPEVELPIFKPGRFIVSSFIFAAVIAKEQQYHKTNKKKPPTLPKAGTDTRIFYLFFKFLEEMELRVFYVIVLCRNQIVADCHKTEFSMQSVKYKSFIQSCCFMQTDWENPAGQDN